MSDQRKERLLQQLEETSLALLMEEYAEADGARLWQEFEAANAAGNAPEIPDQLDAKYTRWFKKAYAKQTRTSRLRRLGKIVLSTAACLLLTIGALSVTVMSVDAFRIPILNYLYANSELASHLIFSDEDSAAPPSADSLKTLLDNMLPAEYQLELSFEDSEQAISLLYQGESDNSLSLDIVPANGTFTFDSEDADITQVDLADHEAYLIIKENTSLVWLDAEEDRVYHLSTKGLDNNIFWSIAKALAQ